MEKKKDVLHHYLDDAERFADLYNVVFFEGKQMIDAKTLREAQLSYLKSGQRINNKNQSEE